MQNNDEIRLDLSGESLTGEQVQNASKNLWN